MTPLSILTNNLVLSFWTRPYFLSFFFCRVSVVEIPSLHVLYWYVGSASHWHYRWIRQYVHVQTLWLWVACLKVGTKFMFLSPPCWKIFNVPARLYRIPIRSPIGVHMLWSSSRYFVFLGYWKFETFTLQFATASVAGGVSWPLPWLLQPATFRLWLTVDSDWKLAHQKGSTRRAGLYTG